MLHWIVSESPCALENSEMQFPWELISIPRELVKQAQTFLPDAGSPVLEPKTLEVLLQRILCKSETGVSG